VPSVVVFLPSLPVTSNGKVDRLALPAAARPAPAAPQAPRIGVERILADIWTEVLGLPHVGSHDNFFAVGGHSLKIVRMAAMIRERLGLELPLRLFFEEPTLSGQVTIVSQLQSRAAGDEGAVFDEAIRLADGDEHVRRSVLETLEALEQDDAGIPRTTRTPMRSTADE
jgi:acyl carrier protein